MGSKNMQATPEWLLEEPAQIALCTSLSDERAIERKGVSGLAWHRRTKTKQAQNLSGRSVPDANCDLSF